MDLEIAKSGRRYTPLPIDTSLGFPQSFALVFEGNTYHFRLYVNIAAERLRGAADFLLLPSEQSHLPEEIQKAMAVRADVLPLPSEQAYLVAHVEREATGGARETVLTRKLSPELEYEAENIALFFPRQIIARSNLNGQGNFGSQVIGGIARRWV
jgi:hypothetical protein